MLSIKSSLDPRRSPEILDDIIARLPADSEHINIGGGTLEYFGNYTDTLSGHISDNAISQDEQTQIILGESIEFLQNLSGE